MARIKLKLIAEQVVRHGHTPADEHEHIFHTNYWGVVNGSLATVRQLRDQGGSIANLGSIGSDSPSPILSTYSEAITSSGSSVSAVDR